MLHKGVVTVIRMAHCGVKARVSSLNFHLRCSDLEARGYPFSFLGEIYSSMNMFFCFSDLLFKCSLSQISQSESFIQASPTLLQLENYTTA